MSTSSRSPTGSLLPTAPLAALITRLRLERSTTQVSRSMGVDRRTVQRVYSRQLIRRDAADRMATALGRHPSEIWDDWFDRRPR